MKEYNYRLNRVTILFLSFISLSVINNISFASATIIRSFSKNAVQCNKWGWLYDSVQTIWDNECVPLEVKSLDGSKIFSIDTRENDCGDNRASDYLFNEGDNKIQFVGCFP